MIKERDRERWFVSRNLCKALIAELRRRLRGLLGRSGGKSANRLCRLLGGGRLSGCGGSGYTSVWDEGDMFVEDEQKEELPTM